MCQNSMKCENTFLRTLEKIYNGKLCSVKEFNEDIRMKLNKYIYQKTHRMFDNVINAPFPKDTTGVTINTLYFKDTWETPFMDDDIKESNGNKKLKFTNSDGSKSDAVYLDASNKSDWKKNKYGNAFVLPYKNNFSFLAFLPEKNISIDTAINELSASSYKDLMKFNQYEYEDNQGQDFCVKAALVEFESEYNKDITYTLKSLGFEDLYNNKNNNFQNISKNANLSIEQTLHGAKIDVNRFYTKAGSYTFNGKIGRLPIERKKVAVDIILNRPFIWMIIDENNMPIFIGTINNLKNMNINIPTKKEDDLQKLIKDLLYSPDPFWYYITLKFVENLDKTDEEKYDFFKKLGSNNYLLNEFTKDIVKPNSNPEEIYEKYKKLI